MASSAAGLRGCAADSAKDIHDSNTNLAQGGIIYRGREESPEQLVEDVLAACRVELASGGDALGRRGPRLVKDVLIDELGVPFDRVRAGRCTPMHSA